MLVGSAIETVAATLYVRQPVCKSPRLSPPLEHLSRVAVTVTIGSFPVTKYIDWPTCDLDKLIDIEGDVSVSVTPAGRFSELTGFTKHGLAYTFA